MMEAKVEDVQDAKLNMKCQTAIVVIHIRMIIIIDMIMIILIAIIFIVIVIQLLI